MHAAKLQRYGLAALVTALATLLVISGFFYRDWKRYQLTFEQTNQAHRILTLNQVLIDRLRDAETGQRGFLLTDRPEYLEPYNAAVERLPADLNELHTITAETPEQRRRFLQLQSLATDKLSELRRTIELRRTEGLNAARQWSKPTKASELWTAFARFLRKLKPLKTSAGWQPGTISRQALSAAES